MTPRACPNWLTTFEDWIKPRSEAPLTYIYWSGLFTLASVIKRKVNIPKNKMLGSWECYPNIYVVFVGPPATRKTTTMDYADQLLADVPNVTEAADSMTQQVLAKRISEAKDCAVSIRAGELGTFINPSGSVMIDFLVSVFDGRRKFSTDTLMRNVEFSDAPCVNMIAATTPVWISNNLSELMVGGGLTSRTMMIYEEDLRRKQLFYEELDYEYLEKLNRNLKTDLVHIATNIAGEFRFSEDAKLFAEEWYRGLKTPDDYRLAGYFGRKHVHLFKVAMLLHLAYSDDLIITKKDLTDGIKLLETVERKLSNVYQSVGKNQFTDVMDAILGYIALKGKVPRKELLSRFYQAAQPATLLELINALIAMEKVSIDSVTGDYIYKRAKPVIDPTTVASS